MKKLAIFVEGQTEQIFIERLLQEAAGKHSISIEKKQALGGQSTRRYLRLIQGASRISDSKFYAQIIDCRADNRVGSDVRDSYEGLVNAGFSSIIAIRDVSPDFKPSEIEQLRTGLRYRMRTRPVEVVFALGVMEVEAWFIAEYNHFSKISPTLTPDLIKSKLGFDPRTDDLQKRPHPAEDLKQCYRLVGQTYNKNAAIVQRTISVLDYERVWLDLPSRFPDLRALVAEIDRFLSP
ncbi:MAG: DUF4276 family protein [Nitrospira sp.]|nr:DUF4276 family protein [Nitrospira sp.]MDH4250885.1 DUF4276 family protein [Nitrospira sp.]MDH5335572.1 DUF4276 family protein [Nitrospira sp.]